ncbi:hypothetical protein F2Q69_00002738 [Brassica cretica]|uniref:Uncharacterized protein n=1 Tax=Brassica cretica TaxID=69181 RepID=A0A8S9P4R3_BRACR|nr:hypothetical protein F2Q69_00002738 [Brassica cretica]
MAATKCFLIRWNSSSTHLKVFQIWDDLPVSRLKYNALDDFQEVFQTTSRKSSRRLPGSLPDDFHFSRLDFLEVF